MTWQEAVFGRLDFPSDRNLENFGFQRTGLYRDDPFTEKDRIRCAARCLIGQSELWRADRIVMGRNGVA
jgi:hypothetical protein